MNFRNNAWRNILQNRAFLLFLFSQGIFCTGDAFQFIAVTSLLVKITGNGLYAGFGLLCGPFAGILLSQLSGSLGDRLFEKYMLVIPGLIKGVIILLFISNRSIWCVYTLILLLSLLDAFSSPPRKKFLVNVLKGNSILAGNSLMNGIYGFSFIFGTTAAGIVMSILGEDFSIFISSLMSISSSLLILAVKLKPTCNTKRSVGGKSTKNSIFMDMISGFGYFKSNSIIREYIIMQTVVCFGTAAVNIAFYPFAFDFLGVNARIWGLMMSVYYGTNLLSMFISFLFNDKISRHVRPFIFFPLLAVSITWFYYGVVNRLAVVLFLQFLEGTAISLSSTVLSAKLQAVTNRIYIARIMGINEILNDTGKLAGIAFGYAAIAHSSCRSAFVFSSLILFIFILYKMIISGMYEKKPEGTWPAI